MILNLYRKGFSNWITVFLVLLLNSLQGSAQIVFEVSFQNGHKVSSKFADDALGKALRTGEISPEHVLRIFVGINRKDEIGSQSAILGSYKVLYGQIEFEPLVPFSETLQYLAVFGDSAEYPFQLTKPLNRPQTRLIETYPTTDTVPANLLKIYLQFSGPMREGEVYDRVQIFRKNHDLVINPFVRLQPELWDHSGHLLTLWLDPGRVKRALGSRETYGPILEAGFEYLLVIDSLWKDVNGQKIKESFLKTFYVVPPDRTKPQTSKWHIDVPVTLTRDPLIIGFGAPMDLATAQHAFSVWNKKGEELSGIMEVVENEKLWKFVPNKYWKPGKYRLRIYSKLEDLAGNNLNRVFDRDLSIDPITPSEQEYYWIEFEISDEK